MPAARGCRSSMARPTGSIGALAVAPSDPHVVYAGSGEGLQRPDLAVGDGVYKSVDGGATWTHLGLRDGQQIASMAVDPANPNRLFVAVLGHPYGPNCRARSLSLARRRRDLPARALRKRERRRVRRRPRSARSATSSTQRYGRRDRRRGRSARRSRCPAAAFSNRTTAERRGRS